MKKIIASLVVFLFIISLSKASDDLSEKWKVGAFSFLNLNFHSADFQKLPGIPSCCPRYETGFGSGFSIGLLTEYPLSKKFYLGLRADYNSFGGTLTASQGMTEISSGEPVDGSFDYSVTSNIKDYGFSLYGSYNPAGGFLLSMGVRLGFISQSSFSQKETLNGPGTFLDSLGNDTYSAVRNVYAGEIPNANSITFCGLWGASYEIPLNKNKTLFLAPEMTFYYNYVPVSKDLKWKVSSLRLGVALKFLPLYQSSSNENKGGELKKLK